VTRVLVIDDNTDITDMLSFYLKSIGGYECKVLNDGREGLDAIRSEDFDVTILDLAMPEFSGVDVINSLKEDNLLGKKNIVVLTASTVDGKDAESFLQDGIKAILKKPISVDELTAVMQKFGH
jgi:two-component system, OmpR family, response regulator